MGTGQGHPQEGQGRKKRSGAVRWWNIAGGISAILSVLGFFGVHSLAQPQPAPPQSTPSTAAYAPPPEISTTTITSTTYEPEPPATTSTDPSYLDYSSTDYTPFTPAAMLASAFTSDLNGTFTLVAAGSEPCDQAYGISSSAANEFTSNGCTAVMTGEYLENDANSSNDVLVSVQIIPFESTSADDQVYQFIRNNALNYGIWCSPNDDGSAACAPGYATAIKSQWVGTDHRYLVLATALYTDLTQDPSVQDWLNAAAKKADYASGPGK